MFNRIQNGVRVHATREAGRHSERAYHPSACACHRMPHRIFRSL